MFAFCSHSLRNACGPDLLRAYPKSVQQVVHNGIAVDEFRPFEQENDGRFRVGIVANLVPFKGHGDFLRMAAELTRRGVDAEYRLIGSDAGDGSYKQELEQLTHELRLIDRVFFLGHQEKMPDVIGELDVVVCSSHGEPFGMCLIEAMACGKPVVATRLGGPCEIVEHERTGFLAAPHSPTELADRVQQLYGNDELRKTLGRAGRQRAVAEFSQDAFVERMIRCYEALVAI
jgi:glycosyltransferase involved in cell wall biosynthesis